MRTTLDEADVFMQKILKRKKNLMKLMSLVQISPSPFSWGPKLDYKIMKPIEKVTPYKMY